MNPQRHAARTDRALRLLADSRRRQVLHHLADADGSVTLDQLAESLRGATSAGPRATRDRLVLDLHHVHLPMLQDGGLVEYDDSRATIDYRADAWVEEVLLTCSSS